ncbi:glycosyltransferase [Bacteroidota bacterium]
MRKPKVLMLGWEIPPNISGGLGIACYGLCQALAPKVKLTIIFPRIEDGGIVKGATSIGLNQIDLEKILTKEEIRKIYTTVEKKEFLFSFSPYLTHITKSIKETSQHLVKVDVKPDNIPDNIFREAGNYDQDIMLKVKTYAKIVSIIAEELDFDIIHAHDWMTFPAAVELKKKFKKPLLLHIHSLDYDRVGPVDSSWVFGLEKTAMKVADLIIPVSQYTGRVLEEHYKIPKDKIRPVHNAIEAIIPFHSKKPFPEKMVLFIGRITHQKGPDYFLKTARKVIQSNENVKFVLAGEGDQLWELMHNGEYNEIRNHIEFTGHLEREKVFELLSMADVFCMTSVSEPFGIAALEAAQFNVPVILSSKSGVSEVLPGALIADYWDTDLMADQILKLLDDKKLSNQVIKKNQKALKSLTWDNAADKILESYLKMI